MRRWADIRAVLRQFGVESGDFTTEQYTDAVLALAGAARPGAGRAATTLVPDGPAPEVIDILRSRTVKRPGLRLCGESAMRAILALLGSAIVYAL